MSNTTANSRGGQVINNFIKNRGEVLSYEEKDILDIELPQRSKLKYRNE